MSLISTDLFEKTLVEPIKNGADELFIISGYATATMAMRHIEYIHRVLKKDFKIRIIVGMCPQDGIQNSQHLGFQKLSRGEYKNDFECNYIVNRPPVHSKVYTWFKNGSPFLGFLGSANYTQNAFSNSMREILAPENAMECFNYYNDLLSQSISCLSNQVSNYISLFERRPFEKTINGDFDSEQQASFEDLGNSEKVTLTLLDNRTGEVPIRSGLNWGQRPEYGRNPNQAYLNIPADICRSGFFPERHVQFMVLTDDDKELICVRAQDGGKGLHSTLDNSLLGVYFRYRLGLGNGDLVKKEHLLKYGRTDVDIYKIDDETYYMDFSVK